MCYKWDDTPGTMYLRDDDGKILGHLKKEDAVDEWLLYAPDVHGTPFVFHAKTKEEAMWRATLIIYDECNHIIHRYMRIRNHLPSLRELAEEARVI